ncbi:hypothetical protein CDAR_532641 [Caerostris darwini]|uniref:Uncharacterized protein n=1 Tax=Caerostris darwini TaxID=1538125 RepID=A0AAV4VX93_9ARAC|nr:hypothetical protein CDAR_532641 [Caerostris darwini]
MKRTVFEEWFNGGTIYNGNKSSLIFITIAGTQNYETRKVIGVCDQRYDTTALEENGFIKGTLAALATFEGV